MAGYSKILPPTSEYWEKCARHTSSHTARTLQTGYYCDRCTRRLTHEAFNDRPPVYHGGRVRGFCGLCNRRKYVFLRQWFACAVCWNVIVAYQKSIVASKAVRDYWRKEVAPEFPELTLLEKEAVSLSPYAKKAKSKAEAAKTLTTLDFLVKNRRLKKKRLLFHIELKSGPGSIEEMREFQLDINDSNDIIGAANNTHLSVYIFHVRTEFRYNPPTRASVAREMWWTDIFTLLKKRLSVRARRGEDKRAGYYSPAAFQTMDTFSQELQSKRYRELQRRLSRRRLRFTRSGEPSG